MKTSNKTLLIALGLGLALPLATFAEDAKITKPTPAVGDAVMADVTATIQAINVETREVTLKGPLGNVATLTVDPRVKRLAEFKVGDEIAATYYASIAAELRAPTEEEKASPLAIDHQVARAAEGSAPGGGALRTVKAIVTVEGLDRPTSSATLKGPHGEYATVRVKDPGILTSLHLGDTLIVTYTEALAVELKKVEPKKAP